jgi:hypothetical protein
MGEKQRKNRQKSSHLFKGVSFVKKNRLFLKKSNARFFQKQPVFFRGYFSVVKSSIMHNRFEGGIASVAPVSVKKS